MNIDRAVPAFAGVMIRASAGLSQIHSVHWLWLTALVGANMLQSSVTGYCPLVVILRRFGIQTGPAFK